MLRTFVTHNPEDLGANFGRTSRAAFAADVAVNTLDRHLTTDELVEHSAVCQVVIADRATPGEAAGFDRNPGLTPENADAQAMSSVEQVSAIVAHELPPRAVNADDATSLRTWWGT